MSAEEIQHTSLALYNFMCRHIVGFEEAVKAKRLLITVRDNLSYSENITIITSGSFGEGLEMKGSDFDFMYVLKPVKVYENISDTEWDASNINFEINTHDTKLGFVKLQLRHGMNKNVIHLCVKYNDNLFLSNILFKQYHSNMFRDGGTGYLAEVNHGPCLSDKDGVFDFAFCRHSKSWINQADHWRTRPRGSWPSNEVVSSVVEHGVLFVPIGVKGSPNEELEWRISFSVGEKLLIYSFNHTQLLCYALMKIVLKDIISTDLLCSYYLKNILFWVSEETTLSEWEPRNLIHCFMRCFNRLIYCVEYALCPHYFIPEINMFENKIEGPDQRALLHNLYKLYNLGWRCILLSPQMNDFSSVNAVLTEYPESFADYCEQMSLSVVFEQKPMIANYHEVVQNIMFYKSKLIKLYYYLHLLHSCQSQAEEIDLNQKNTNKTLYRKYKTCQSYLVQGLRSNAVTGWLMLASFYYRIKQYKKVFVIVNYGLSKCSCELLDGKYKLSSLQRRLLDSKILQRKGLVRVLQLLRAEFLVFHESSTLIPQELEIDIRTMFYIIPPVVFSHFLSFLCHYHLNDVREYRKSLADLQIIISEKYFIEDSICELSSSYNILGVVLHVIGENDSAMEAFHHAAALDPEGLYSCAQQRLIMMNEL